MAYCVDWGLHPCREPGRNWGGLSGSRSHRDRHPERDFARRIGQFGFGPAMYVNAEVREVLLPQQVAVLSMQRALNFLILELRLRSKHFNEVFVCQNNHVASRPG